MPAAVHLLHSMECGVRDAEGPPPPPSTESAPPAPAPPAAGGPAILAAADGATPKLSAITYNIVSVTGGTRKKGLAEWVWTIMGKSPPEGLHKAGGCGLEGGEMQVMLPASTSNQLLNSGEVCLLTESPYRILRAAESGNVEDFMRLYYGDPTRLSVRDARGRSAAHQAAAKNSTNILQFIYNYGGDLNVLDLAGNTPLHLAIEEDALDAIDVLMQMHVDTSILNDKKQAPIHVAAELNKVAVLEVLSKYKEQVDVDLGGEHGRTALHLAAIHDHDQCARILIMEFGAVPKRPCNNGYYPIHEAAKNASSRTMEEFLKWGESRGYSREEMISLYDNEGNLPLHSAVHGGDIKAVELCIKSGAKISTQQHDLSTPVHLACAQGALEIVKLMFNLQPKEKQVCLSSCDVQRMTPIHCAAMFDHADIVKYLVTEGSEMNALDKERRSPLLLAASRGGWRTVHVLIQLGANINLTDINSRNVLHLVVMNGGCLAEFAAACKQEKGEKSLNQLLNEKDHTGCSPLHYASREGHIRSLENLIKLGACINLKNNNNESPLHFAARYGRYHSACQLLDSDKGTFIINESDGEGQTPLHIASSEGHIRVVQLLLNRGALLHRDHNGRNPLHLAAMSGYTQTIEVLHSVHSHLLDQVDKDGNTALHLATMENRPNSIALLLSMGCRLLYNKLDMSAIDYAIYYKYPEAALSMVTHEFRAPEVMSLRSVKHPCVTLALIACMPNVFTAVQDKCITKADCKKDSKSFYVKYSFHTLMCTELKDVRDVLEERVLVGVETGEIKKGEVARVDGHHEIPKTKSQPLAALNAMVAHGRVELLAHPLSQKYLQMKWNSYGKYFHLANLLFYSIFLTFVTMYSYMLMSILKPDNRAMNIATLNITDQTNFDGFKKNDIMATMTVSAVAILTYNALCVTREMYNIAQRKWHYLLDPNNLVSWMLYACSGIMVFPTFMGQFQDVQYSAAAITVFFAWLQLLLLLQRFDQVGIYVVMFLEILQTLMKVLIVFSILIIAFGLAFYILLSNGNHLSFNDIPMSLMRTFTMMLGELDFIGTFVEPYYMPGKGKALENPGPVFFILCVFMVLMPILLMNLLIGLAVGDIESVRRNAQLKRLAMQVVLHTELESQLPAFLLAKVDKNELIEYPNEAKCKVNCVDFILRKWFCNPFTEENGLDIPLETSDEHMASEVTKIKRRVKDMGSTLDNQHNLIRLIVQKMEIRTEADDVDEGVPSEVRTTAPRWTPPRGRHQLRSAASFNKGSHLY